MAIADVTTKGLEELKARFKDTILKVDATIKSNLAKDPKIIEKKTKEANEVLKYYKTLIEDDMKRRVAAEWARFIGNRKELAEFRTNTAVKVVLGTIGVGVAVASVALSFGAAWPNIVAIVKGISDIGKAIKTATESMDTTYERLFKNLGEIDKLNQQRRKAEEQGKGQKAAKAKQAAKEVVAGVLPITKLMLKTASAVKDDCKKFRGDISKLETQADQLSGRLNKILKELHGLPDKELTAAQRKVCAEMTKGVDDLIAQITDLTVKSTNAGAFAARVEKAVKELEGHDEWGGTLAGQVVGVGSKGAAISGLTNFITACANHGVTLIAMI